MQVFALHKAVDAGAEAMDPLEALEGECFGHGETGQAVCPVDVTLLRVLYESHLHP